MENKPNYMTASLPQQRVLFVQQEGEMLMVKTPKERFYLSESGVCLKELPNGDVREAQQAVSDEVKALTIEFIKLKKEQFEGYQNRYLR